MFKGEKDTSESLKSDGAASGEAEFTQTIPSRDRARRSQALKQRAERLSLLRLSRVVTEQGEAKLNVWVQIEGR